jgi:hypothetical protein
MLIKLNFNLGTNLFNIQSNNNLLISKFYFYFLNVNNINY